MKRVVVIVDDATKQEQDIVTKWLQSAKYGYWHHMSHVWLVTDMYDRLSPALLRDKVRELLPGKSPILTIGVDSKDAWAGFGLPEQFEWVNEIWSELPPKPTLPPFPPPVPPPPPPTGLLTGLPPYNHLPGKK